MFFCLQCCILLQGHVKIQPQMQTSIKTSPASACAASFTDLPVLNESALIIIKKAMAHDKEAFSQLVKQYWLPAYRLACMMLTQKNEVEKVLQETFWQIYLKLPTLQTPAHFSTFVYRMTANASLMHLRLNPRAKQLLLDELLPHFEENGTATYPVWVGDWSLEMGHSLPSQALKEQVQMAVHALPHRYRLILLMKETEQLSTTQIAYILGLSLSAVKSILHRARLFVCEQLSQYFQGRPL